MGVDWPGGRSWGGGNLFFNPNSNPTSYLEGSMHDPIRKGIEKPQQRPWRCDSILLKVRLSDPTATSTANLLVQLAISGQNLDPEEERKRSSAGYASSGTQ